MSVKVTGLDLSITATGVGHEVEGLSCTHLIKTKGTADDRLPVIRNHVREYTAGADLALIEGLGFASARLAQSGMVHGTIRTMLMDQCVPYATVPPNSLKKYATGNGTADKTMMALAAYKRFELEFTDDNECDGFWLWVMAKDYLGEPVIQLPALNRESLKKITRAG